MKEKKNNTPYPAEVEKDKSYFICSCGLSANQPFCDGSHVNTDYLPIMYKAKKKKTLYFCSCKKSSALPLCDGTHNKL